MRRTQQHVITQCDACWQAVPWNQLLKSQLIAWLFSRQEGHERSFYCSLYFDVVTYSTEPGPIKRLLQFKIPVGLGNVLILCPYDNMRPHIVSDVGYDCIMIRYNCHPLLVSKAAFSARTRTFLLFQQLSPILSQYQVIWSRTLWYLIYWLTHVTHTQWPTVWWPFEGNRNSVQILVVAVMSLFEEHRFQGFFQYSGLISASTLPRVGDFVSGAPVQKLTRS